MIQPDGLWWISEPVAFRGKYFALAGENWHILCFSLTTFKIIRFWLLFSCNNQTCVPTMQRTQSCSLLKTFSVCPLTLQYSLKPIFSTFHLRLSGAPRLLYKPCAFSPDRFGSLLMGQDRMCDVWWEISIFLLLQLKLSRAIKLASPLPRFLFVSFAPFLTPCTGLSSNFWG